MVCTRPGRRHAEPAPCTAGAVHTWFAPDRGAVTPNPPLAPQGPSTHGLHPTGAPSRRTHPLHRRGRAHLVCSRPVGRRAVPSPCTVGAHHTGAASYREAVERNATLALSEQRRVWTDSMLG